MSFRRMQLYGVIAAAGALAAGCDGSDVSEPDGGAHSIRGARYCEVLAAFLQPEGIHVEVWGTQGLSDCPLEDWKALDASAIQSELGATGLVMNGPRHWVLDDVEAYTLPDVPQRRFGELAMRQLATLTLPLGPIDRSPYVERAVSRDTRFSFWANSEIYELVAPDGSVYVMQSSSQVVDPELGEAELPGLGARLELPAGWAYQARTLPAELEVEATGEAVIVQDDLQNTYQRHR